MAKEECFVYLRDNERTRTGFPTIGDAQAVASGLSAHLAVPEWRIRVRLRQRNGLFDVVVKRRTALREDAK